MTLPLPIEIRFLKRYAKALHQAGVPAHQLEGLIQAIARWMGYRCDIWSSPTAVFLSLRTRDDEDEQKPLPMQLVRLRPGAINLAVNADLYEMGEDLIAGRVTLEAANEQLKQDKVPLLYSNLAQVLAAGLVSGAFAVLLSSSWLGVSVAALAGLLVGLLPMALPHSQRVGSLEALAALAVSLFVYGFNAAFAGVDTASIIMSGLIVLMPGLSLTIAVTELSTEHLSSGSARLAGALAVLLKLALGVLVGSVIAGWLGWTTAGTLQWGAASPPDWFHWPALLSAGLAFAVLFNVRHRDIYLAVLAAVTGYAASRAGVILGGVEFGILLAALVVALLGNLLGRWLRRPASLIRVPGIILLVPGALGYRTVTNVLLQSNPNPQETAMFAALLVVALVGGLLIGNTIVPPRRFL
ncbi:MAG: threonine/serine exporter family protein [Xanthomonadales bacterium]|nr:threonine/serine exporter family protein [Xanthomonadales bacterium]